MTTAEGSQSFCRPDIFRPLGWRPAVHCMPQLILLVARSRARKGADGGIPAEKPGLHNPHRRAVDCAPYLTLHASGVKDWKRSFWSAVLQHRFRFD